LLVSSMLFLPFVDFAKANFDVYKIPPQVTVSSPITNMVYDQSTIPLNVQVKMTSHWVTAYEKLSWMKYSIDGQSEVNLTVKDGGVSNSGSYASGSATISSLSIGAHSLSVFGQTALTNFSTGVLSNFRVTIYFVVVGATSSIQVLSPQSKTYDSTNVTLQFRSDKPLLWSGYSLDDNIVVAAQSGTIITKLSNGLHNLRLYGNDSSGKIYASQTTTFTINGKKPPSVTIDKEAIVQTRAKLPSDFQDTTLWKLIFHVNEPTSWMGYSLDRGVAQTIEGNITLRLSYGSHIIVVYAKDDCGNMGASQPYTFVLAAGEAGSAYTSASPTSHQTRSPTPTSSVPEFSWLTILPILLTIPIAMIIARKRLQRNV
jgi:hypothetical protein